MKATMTFTEAAEFQAAFDAVATGIATYAQAVEVDAVVNAIFQMMQPIGERAGRIMDGRANLLAAIPEDKRAAVLEAIDGKDISAPRLTVVRKSDGTAEVGTPDEVAAVAAELEAAKAA